MKSRLATALALTAFSFGLLIAASAEGLTIELARFGTCVSPPGCTVTISDGGAGDLNPAPGVIDFSVQLGVLPGGIFTAAGTATETITRNAAGVVTSILLVLTSTTVQGVAGGVGGAIPGQIGVLSNVPIVSLAGVSGFASLAGQYQSASGTIGFASVLLEARVGGGLLGRVNPPPAVNIASPVPFSGTSTGVFPFPVNNLLIGTLNFSVGPGDAFFLPTSADSFAQVVPEPTTLMLVGPVGMIGLALWRRRRARGSSGG